MKPLTYIHISWLHDFVDQPVELWSELDDKGFETRKVEVFRCGKLGYADSSNETHSTRLNDQPMPDFSEIAVDPQFAVKKTDKATFEVIWKESHSTA